MSILTRQLVLAIVYILDQLLSIYSMILFVAILITWVNPDPGNPIVRFLHSVTEPVLYQIRRRRGGATAVLSRDPSLTVCPHHEAAD